MARMAFQQVDVFSQEPLKGNPVAVVLGADGLSDEEMAAFANWTNLSETTFVLKPTDPQADYTLRIFTPETEFPFAGHPTLGSCHAWLEAGGRPRGERIIQECGVGLVPIRRTGGRLAFAAPPLRRSGPLGEALLAQVAAVLRIDRSAIVDAQWADNGPGWIGVLLGSRSEVLALKPDFLLMADLSIGVAGAWDPAKDGPDAQFEVRAFAASAGVNEDPVTGSLNAALAQWLIGSGRAPDAYTASQGAALGRAGRVHVERVGQDIWVGGATTTVVEGTVTIGRGL